MKKLKILKSLKLAESEKKDLFERIRNSIRELPGRAGADLRYPVESSFYKHMFFVHPVFMKTGAFAVFILFVSSATTFASLPSLPGDFLYGLKINVVEKVAGISARTPERRAEIEAIHLEKRIKEFEALAETGRLTPETGKVLEESIDEKLKDFDESVKAIEESGKEEAKAQAEQAEEVLESKIEKHKEKIIEIIEEKSEGEHDAAIQAVQAVIDRAETSVVEEGDEVEGTLEEGSAVDGDGKINLNDIEDGETPDEEANPAEDETLETESEELPTV